MASHSFHKVCLFTFLIAMLFVTGCSALTPQKAQPKTMREELLEFAQGPHPEGEMSDEKATKILEKFIHVGMPIEQALELSNKNGIRLTKASRNKPEIDRDVDAYVGIIDHIWVPMNLLIYQQVRVILETKHNQQYVTSAKAYYFVFSRID